MQLKNGPTGGSGRRAWCGLLKEEGGAFIGKTLVRITSDDRVRVGGKNFENKEIFPARYNVNSQQIVEVVAGRNKFDFACDSGGESAPPPVSGGGT